MLYNLELIYHSIPPTMLFVCIWVGVCAHFCMCLCLYPSTCFNKTRWHIWDAFCEAIYMMTNYVEKYRCNRNKSCDIDIFSYNLGNLLKGVACIKMKIQFVLGHFEHVDNLGCPI